MHRIVDIPFASSASIPGLNITGYGVLEVGGGRLRLCEAGVVRGKSRGLADASGWSRSTRAWPT